MILIKKKTEPYEWKRYRHTPEAVYQSQDGLVNSLLEEQGYLCAYCMRRIPCKDRVNGTLTQEDHRVEHIKCRNVFPELQLSYTNMVVCCPGHLGEHEHCDRLKKDQPISFSPMDKNFISTLFYENGKIKSTNDRWMEEMEDILNLNDEALIRARRQTLSATIDLLAKTNAQKPWTRQMVEKYLLKYSTMHNEKGKLKHYPYCGIVIYYLQKKLKQLL